MVTNPTVWGKGLTVFDVIDEEHPNYHHFSENLLGEGDFGILGVTVIEERDGGQMMSDQMDHLNNIFR